MTTYYIIWVVEYLIQIIQHRHTTTINGKIQYNTIEECTEILHIDDTVNVFLQQFLSGSWRREHTQEGPTHSPLRTSWCWIHLLLMEASLPSVSSSAWKEGTQIDGYRYSASAFHSSQALYLNIVLQKNKTSQDGKVERGREREIYQMTHLLCLECRSLSWNMGNSIQSVSSWLMYVCL